MASFPELGTDALTLWRLCGEADNQLCCEVEAEGDLLILLVSESGTGNVTREVHPDIEPLVLRADAVFQKCVAAGWLPLEFDEELSP